MKNKISIFLILIIFNTIIFANINVISETRNNNNIIIWDKNLSGEMNYRTRAGAVSFMSNWRNQI